MNRSCDKSLSTDRRGERGGARLKFFIIISIVAVTAYVGYQYVPISFQAYQYKDFMQEIVNKGAALGKTSEWVKDQLVKNGGEYGVPPNAVVAIEAHEGAMKAHVQFKRTIDLPGYTYVYDFDHTAKSSTLWSNK
jgi:hypothetical protein